MSLQDEAKRQCAGLGAQVEKPTAYNDERFRMIHSKARELKGLLRELNDMANHKFNELLGEPPEPVNPCDGAKCISPDQSWVDKVIDEQDISLRVVRDTLERMSMV